VMSGRRRKCDIPVSVNDYISGSIFLFRSARTGSFFHRSSKRMKAATALLMHSQ
jgi:hypothetical protein